MGCAKAAHGLHLAEEVVEYVAPVAQHIEDDAAAFGLLASSSSGAAPAAPNRLQTPSNRIRREPRTCARETDNFAQHPDLAQSGKEQLILHDAVDFLRLGKFGDPNSRACPPQASAIRLCRLRSRASEDRRASALSRRQRTPCPSGFLSAASRSVVERSIPYRRARCCDFSLRCGRPGSHHARSPFGHHPALPRIATIERSRCWLSPCAACMMMPSLRTATIASASD